MKTLDELKKELDLTPIHLILLVNTGSMTVLLEALFGRIKIVTEAHQVIEAEEEIAGVLDITGGEPVNHRVVRLTNKDTLVHATSYAPLSRLEKGFTEDIMKQDIPIGRIMANHRLESRREILGFDWLRAGDRFSGIFSIAPDSILLKRNYNIIHKGKPLINITEVFPYAMVR